MKTVLGLDISSSTIGWALIEYDSKEYKLNMFKYETIRIWPNHTDNYLVVL